MSFPRPLINGNATRVHGVWRNARRQSASNHHRDGWMLPSISSRLRQNKRTKEERDGENQRRIGCHVRIDCVLQRPYTWQLLILGRIRRDTVYLEVLQSQSAVTAQTNIQRISHASDVDVQLSSAVLYFFGFELHVHASSMLLKLSMSSTAALAAVLTRLCFESFLSRTKCWRSEGAKQQIHRKWLSWSLFFKRKNSDSFDGFKRFLQTFSCY